MSSLYLRGSSLSLREVWGILSSRQGECGSLYDPGSPGYTATGVRYLHDPRCGTGLSSDCRRNRHSFDYSSGISLMEILLLVDPILVRFHKFN